MPEPTVVLFYKRLTTLGGAEVLMAQHYGWLKRQGYAPKVVCFEATDVARVEIDARDVIVASGSGALAQTLAVAAILRRLRPQQTFCHSGRVEFCPAAVLAGVRFAIFEHQPTTMSYNEPDKLAIWYFGRYRRFARRDRMYDEIVAAERAQSLHRRVFVNLRALLSQWGLRRAARVFVLSDFAVREKRQIFGLSTVHLSGAVPRRRIEALRRKSEPRPPDGPATLVSVSRLDENKRVHILVDAVKRLVERGRLVRLLIGGTGPARADLERQVEASGLSGHVSFLGYVPEERIAALYAGMDLFVTIDWADFRITTYEALAENRRVVVSDDTDVDPALLASGYVFVAPADADRLADVVANALDAPVRWDRSQLAAYLDRFSWETYFSRIAQEMSAGD